MTRVFSRRFSLLAVLAAAEIAVLSLVAIAPASAQWFDQRFPFQRRQSPYQQQQSPYQQQQNSFPFFQQQPERPPPPVDYSKAPAPRSKDESGVQTSVVVLGDSMADWLAYGLETAFTDSPEMGVLRRHRTWSGLIRQEVRRDPRGEHPDWPKAAREMLAPVRPDFIVMMIGLNDRRAIREQRPPPRAATPKAAQPAEPAADPKADPKAEQKPEQKADQKAEQKTDQKPDPKADATKKAELPDDEQSPAEAPASEPEPAGRGAIATHEFRSEKWAELYIKRIDETIAALKSKGVPVFWVGLPPVRGTRSMADMSYLNDLYRSRADKAGIVYVDVWDGFVDEAGRYAQHGPDFEGQIRRLRAGDGVHFTQAGARKLAHFVEREVQRWMTARTTPVALPVPEEPAPKATEAPRPGGGGIARPLAGPVVPLTAARSVDGDELLGGSGARQSAADAVATKVLVKGEPVPAPAGRADDFAWPRRGVAPVGADPVVATTTLPMTPMRGEQPSATAQGPAAPPARTAAVRPPGPRPPGAQAQSQYRPEPRRSQPFFFPFLFGR